MRRRTRVVVIARSAGPWRSPWVVIARPAGRGDPLRLSLRGAKPRGNLLEQGDCFASLATLRGSLRYARDDKKRGVPLRPFGARNDYSCRADAASRRSTFASGLA